MKKYYNYAAMRQLSPAATGAAAATEGKYQYPETGQLVTLVNEAAKLLQEKGEEAFAELRQSGSRWQQGESYIFVLDPEGNMLVHPDPELEGKNQLQLKDINGKPIIQGLLDAAASQPQKTEGWYHYQWPVPGGLLPRWKSSYVKLVQAPSGKRYTVGSGMYNDRMEREFVVDMVKQAVAAIEKNQEEAFRLLRDPKGPFRAKDAYVFVVDPDGTELVNPGFPSLEGQKFLDQKDTQGKLLNREMLETVETKGSGWVDYMWPKPGESVSTQKSAYVTKANTATGWVMVGCGVYLADAPKAAKPDNNMTARDLETLVHEAAAELEAKGEKAYPAFREKGSKWLHDDIYLFVWSMDGHRAFHAEKPEGEGQDVSGLKDVLGKPFGKMFLEIAASPEGEGWLHCMWPKPYDIFPTWKSCYVKRVTYPDGKQYLVGSGLYNMQLDKAFIEDEVNRAAALVEQKGEAAFEELRDKKGPFVFMDTYVFVQTPEGTELVNPAQPSLEGKNLIDMKDLKGKPLVKEEIEAALKHGSAWLDGYWYQPGDNIPALKQTFVKKVQSDGQTFVVGSGLYVPEGRPAEAAS